MALYTDGVSISAIWDPPQRDGTFDRGLKFREQMDMPNALLLLEATGDAFELHCKETQDAAIAVGIPAFFSASMPKSAGTFLHNCLRRMGAAEVFNVTQNPVDFYQSYLVESWLRVFMLGGSCCHNHMSPTPWNLQVIRKVGARRLWIHARDPRQAALSAFWHTKGRGQGEGEIAKERLADDARASRIRSDIVTAMGDLPFEARSFNEQIQCHFLWMHQWIVDWIQASEACPEISFLFTTFEDMVRDINRFERSLFQFFGYEHRGPAVFERHPEDRFRLGQTAEWRSVYSPELIDWLAQRIDPAIYLRMGWEIAVPEFCPRARSAG